MAKSPRYTTFAPGELEAKLRELSPNGVATSWGNTERAANGRFLKTHSFAVSFPDGTEGSCCYERLGPKFHRFIYTYCDGTLLPHQIIWEEFPNDPVSLEQEGQSRAVACYQDAAHRERREYFCRASEPSDGSRKQRPERYRMKAKTAKELSGHYVICQVCGTFLLPISVAYHSLEQANAAWKQIAQPETVVACCNRLDRCWECPKFNPLYADCHLRELAQRLAPERLGRKEKQSDESLSGTAP